MRLLYLLHGRPAKAQASMRIHWMAARVRLKNEVTEDEKCHNLMRRLIYLSFLCNEKMQASKTNM